MVLVVDRNQFPVDLKPKIGQQLQSRQADGRTIRVTVTEVSESSVTLDANHQLAGKDLIFEIQLVEIL
jgi:peptidylprolyl isomerase